MKCLEVIELMFNLPWDLTELNEEEILTKDAIAIAKAKAKPMGTKPDPCNLEEIRP